MIETSNEIEKMKMELDEEEESTSDEEEEVDIDDADSVTREEKVEKEEFGFEYKGEKLSDDQAKRLLVLIEHASTCPGR